MLVVSGGNVDPGAGCGRARRRAAVAPLAQSIGLPGAQLRVIAEQPLVEVVELARAGDRRPRADPLVVGRELLAAERVAVGVALPALEHVEVDVGDGELVAEAPRPAGELALEVGAVGIELLAALEPDPLVPGRVVGEEARRVERVVRAVERVREPRHPAQQRATAGLAGQRPEAASREPLDEVEQDGARLVDELVAVPQRRDAPQRVDERRTPASRRGGAGGR